VDVVSKIAGDWELNQQVGTRAVEGKPWGWQWGGQQIFNQVAALGLEAFLHSPVLDVGCGGGKWEKWLIDNYQMEVWAIDVQQAAIDQSKKYEPRARYQLCDGESIPHGDLSFGTVFIFDTLLHLPPFLVAKYFLEANRVATDTIVISLPDMGTEFGGQKFMQGVVRKVWRKLYEYGYMNYYTFGQVKRMLELAGWEAILLGHIGALSDRDMVVVGTK
jgi:SAM-dependent methyltransferase